MLSPETFSACMTSPQSVSYKHGPGSEDAQGGVVLLGHQLQVVRVFPFPLRPSVLKPNLDLKKILSFPRPQDSGLDTHLSLCQLELFGELHPLGDGQIFVFLKLALQGLDLSRREGSPGPLLPVITQTVLVL